MCLHCLATLFPAVLCFVSALWQSFSAATLHVMVSRLRGITATGIKRRLSTVPLPYQWLPDATPYRYPVRWLRYQLSHK
jgi:hypothetical protein